MLHSITPQDSAHGSSRPLTAERPEDLVRAFAIASALGRDFPGQRVVNWLATMTSAYDNTAAYWSPYDYFGEPGPGVDMYVLPWARGGMAYQIGTDNYFAFPSVLRVDPSVWYAGIDTRAQEAKMVDDRTFGAFMVAADQTSIGGMFSDEVMERWGHARAAIEQGRMLTDSTKISRRLKAIKDKIR